MANMTRSHKAIVTAAGPEKVKDALGIDSIHTVRSWIVRNRIPADKWAGVVEHGLATFEELAAFAPVEAEDGEQASAA